MRVVIQRVKEARVKVSGQVVGEISQGIVTLFGIAKGDTEAHVGRAIEKILELRIFEDSAGKMNRSLKDIGGGHLVVSQFTLLADLSQGKRPSFGPAESPERARNLYEYGLKLSREHGIETAAGQFGAEMQVELINDGPATFVLDF